MENSFALILQLSKKMLSINYCDISDYLKQSEILQNLQKLFDNHVASENARTFSN